jgi:hypothetical protein
MSQFGTLTENPKRTNYEDENHEFLLNYIDKYNKMVESDNMSKTLNNNWEANHFSIYWVSHKRSLTLEKVKKNFENVETTNDSKKNEIEEKVDTEAAK